MSMTVIPRRRPERPRRPTERRDPPHDPGEAAQDARCWARLLGTRRAAALDPVPAHG